MNAFFKIAYQSAQPPPFVHRDSRNLWNPMYPTVYRSIDLLSYFRIIRVDVDLVERERLERRDTQLRNAIAHSGAEFL